METKGIIATTHIDRHGDKIEKEALETLVQAINTQESAIAVSVEHDGLVMPIGKVLKGNLVQLPDGEFAVTTVQEIFDVHSITPKILMKHFIWLEVNRIIVHLLILRLKIQIG